MTVLFSNPVQSSSDYVSPFELPLVDQPPAGKAKEIEAPAEGNKFCCFF